MKILSHLEAWLRCSFTAMLLLLSTSIATPHELESDRLTLVQRQDRLIDVTWLGDLPAVLHRSLSPNEPYQEFLIRLAASPLDEVERLIYLIRNQWDREINLSATGSTKGKWQRWRWPNAKTLQAAAQERLMSRLSGAHQHPKPLTIQGQWVFDSLHMSSVILVLPSALKPLMVVSYRPQQVMIHRHSESVALTF